MRDVDDDWLVARARRGDGDAFAVLYHRHKLAVWNLAYFMLRDHHSAEDSLQETFLRAYRAIDQYRRRDRVKPWVLRICRNVCLDRLRASPPPLDSLDDLIIEPAARAVDQDTLIDLHQALADLSVEDLEAFFLVDVLGCRSDEAARIVGLRASSTLRSRLGRARRHVELTLSERSGRRAPVQERSVVTLSDATGGMVRTRHV